MRHNEHPVNSPNDAVSLTPTPTRVLTARALQCRRLRECGSPWPPGQELVTVRRAGGLDSVLREIRARETGAAA